MEPALARFGFRALHAHGVGTGVRDVRIIIPCVGA